MSVTVPITVGIPTFQRGDRVLQLLERLQNCNPGPAEILVFLDAGDAVLEQRIREAFPAVGILSSKERIGPGGGRDRCLRAATQPYFVSFDDDSWPVDNDYFLRVAAHFDKAPDVAVLGAVVTQRQQVMPPASQKVHEVMDYTGCGHAMRVSAYISGPGYVDRANAYGLEEKDVSLQLLAHDWRLIECGDLRVFHDTDLAHHHRSEITSATIENAALLPWLRYPVILWPYGMLQYLNQIRCLLSKGRFAGLIQGIVRTPIELWLHRRLRHPVSVKTVIAYLRRRSRWDSAENVVGLI